MFPTTNLQPGQTGPEVKKLQEFLLSQGLLTQQQIASGPGIYGPQTTAAVKKWQQANGVDTGTNAGYWGPRSISVASKINTKAPTNQNVDLKAYEDALAKDPEIKQLTNVDPAAITNAYLTGDWSAVTTPTGTPFSKKMQEEAFNQAEKALKPGFEAQQTYETAGVEDTLGAQQDQFGNFIQQEAKDFQESKRGLDQTAADKGILFSGSRFQKENDLRNTYEQRQKEAADQTARSISNTARDFQYKYGNQNANKLSSLYNLPQTNIYNANVAQGGVRPSMNMTQAYNPSQYKFQGTTLNNQKANTQVRAAGLLANRANKLLGSYNK